MQTKFRYILLLVWLSCVSVGMAAQPDTVRHVLCYPSVDQHGDTITLSRVVSIPAHRTPKGIVFIPHFTISSKYEAPSLKSSGEEKLFCEDYVVVMPDYLGYGITQDRIHPYLHGELTARHCVDMILAAQPLLDSMRLGVPPDSIYIIGFSQGGASALWTLKRIEEHYADRIHVKHCFIGSGPYDVTATFDEAIETNHVGSPLVIPMLVIGTNEAYDLHLDRSEFFTRAMEKKYVKYIQNKEYSVMEVYFRTLNHRVSHWLKPQGMDKNAPQTRRLYSGLIRSGIVGDSVHYEWTPQAPLYVFHSTTDDIVTFRCAEQLRRRYPELPNITYDFGNYGTHLMSSRRFFPTVLEMMQ